MFSFFRRKRSQDEGEKRDRSKSKEKSGSPFFKRKENKKNDGGVVQSADNCRSRIVDSNCSNEVVSSDTIGVKNIGPVCESSSRDETCAISTPNKMRDCNGEIRQYRPVEVESEKNNSLFVGLPVDRVDKSETRDTDNIILNKEKTEFFNALDSSDFGKDSSKEPKRSRGEETSIPENKYKFPSSTTSVDNYSDTTVDLTVFVAKKTDDPENENKNPNEKQESLDGVNFRGSLPSETKNQEGKDVDEAMGIRSWSEKADPFIGSETNFVEKQIGSGEILPSKVQNPPGTVDVQPDVGVNSRIPRNEGKVAEEIEKNSSETNTAETCTGSVPADGNPDNEKTFFDDTVKESSPSKFEECEEPVEAVYSVGRLILEILSPDDKAVKRSVESRRTEAAGTVMKNDGPDKNDAAEGIRLSNGDNCIDTVDVRSVGRIDSGFPSSVDGVESEPVGMKSNEGVTGLSEVNDDEREGNDGVSGGVEGGTPENSPTPERRVGDRPEAGIFEEVPPSRDGVHFSRQCPSNLRAPHDTPPSPPSTIEGSEECCVITPAHCGLGLEAFNSGQNITVEDVPVMTYEIEERGKTDELGDGGSHGYGDCQRASKIEADDGFANFFAKTKYENGEVVKEIGNTEIDSTDIDADSENNSAPVPDGSACDGPENASESACDYNADECENTCEATVKIGKMSGVLTVTNGDQEDRTVKRVRWADIEGGTELCCADSASEYSTEEETETEDDEKQETTLQEDLESSSEEESSESEDECDTAQCKTSVPQETTPLAVNRINALECDQTESVSSSEEESGEESSEESDDESQTDNSIQPKEVKTEESAEEMSYRDGETSELYNQIAELQHNLMAKTTGLERLQNDLESAYNESELARKRYRRLQDELEACKRCNADLIDRLNKQAESANNRGIIEEEKFKEAEERIKELERKLAIAKEETARLQSMIKKLEKDRNEEMRIVQQALDEALEEQHKMETKFGREFEQLRTHNTNRELKLIDDFEWKLREVEKSCKKQIQEKEKLNDQKMAEVCMKLSSAEAELANVSDAKIVNQVAHLKACDSELQQLRSITHDQKKTIRTLNRRLADVQVNEKVLQEETNRLKSALETEKANFSAIQTLHKEDLAEKDRRLHFRLDMQKKHLTLEWEEKLQRECTRIKSELEKTLLEEKRTAVENAKHFKDQENQQMRQIWEKRVQELLREVESLKRKLAQKEENHKYELEKAQSKYDSDILELRRKMDKLDMKYQEQIEKMQEDHEKEIAKTTEECERKIQQTEANLHMQAGTTRATLELVKQQMQKDAEIRIQELREVHHKELEVQWHRLMEEKEKELKDVQEKHKETIAQFQNEIAALRKKSGSREENQNKPSSSGFGKTLKGLFEKKDSLNQNNTDTVKADKSERVGLDKEESTDHKTNQNQPPTEQSENTKDNQPKKQAEDKKQTAQNKQQQGQKESGSSRNQPYTRQNSRRSRKSKSGRR